MKSVNDYYYMCDKDHVTVGVSQTKKKCDAKIQQIKLVKKGKAQTEKEVIKETTCGAEIKKVIEIPKELNLFENWDYQTVKAFMMAQTYDNLKVGFIRCLQEHLTSMHAMITDLQEGVNELIRQQKD